MPSIDDDYRVSLGVVEAREAIQRTYLEERKKRNLKRVDIAEQLGVHRSYVTKILQGNTSISLRLLSQLAAIFNRKLVVKFEPWPVNLGQNDDVPGAVAAGRFSMTVSAANSATATIQPGSSAKSEGVAA